MLRRCHDAAMPLSLAAIFAVMLMRADAADYARHDCCHAYAPCLIIFHFFFFFAAFHAASPYTCRHADAYAMPYVDALFAIRPAYASAIATLLR